MKHYHGTPLGGKRFDGPSFVRNRFVLVPWKRPEDLEMSLCNARGVMVDNSAFSFWSSGETPDWNEYIKWCAKIARHPRFDFALIPDVIDGTEKDNADLISLWDKKAYHPVYIEGCPVWHLHESFARLEGFRDRYRRVAIGSSGQYSSPGVGDWWDRMNDVFDILCDEDGFPRTKVHGLRMLASNIVSTYPFASCDSTNAAQNGVRVASQIKADDLWGKQTIAQRIEMIQSPARWDRKATEQGLLFELSS